MPTKITFIYDNPTDPEAFETQHTSIDQPALARAVPGVLRVEESRVWPKEDGSPTPAYRMLDLYFVDYDTACAALGTPESQRLFPSVFQLATGGVRILFADVVSG